MIGIRSMANVETISANGFSNVSIRTTDDHEWWDFYGANIVGINEIDLGGGDDFLKANSLTNLLRGGEGNDEIAAQQGDDTLHGDAGDDILSGWHGSDHYYGGTGNDYFEELLGGGFYF